MVRYGKMLMTGVLIDWFSLLFPFSKYGVSILFPFSTWLGEHGNTHMNQLSCSAFSGGLAPQPGQKPLKKDEKNLRKKWNSKNMSHHVNWCLLVGKPKNQPRHSKIWRFLETVDPQNPWGFNTNSWSNIVIHDNWMIWWCTSRLGNLHMVYRCLYQPCRDVSSWVKYRIRRRPEDHWTWGPTPNPRLKDVAATCPTWLILGPLNSILGHSRIVVLPLCISIYVIPRGRTFENFTPLALFGTM